MKTSFKLLALILALVMLVAVFAACDGGNNGKGNETASGDVTTDENLDNEVVPGVDKNDYDSTFYLSVLSDSNPMEHFWVQESDNDVLSAALFDRQEKIKNYLGVEIFASSAGQFQTYTEAFKTAVTNRAGGVDTLLTHVHSGISGLITGGFLTPFEDMPGIDLDADYWNTDFMDDLAINDHYLLGFSDFNILYTYVIAYNKDLLVKYEDKLDKSVYDMVDDYEWTLQQFSDVAKLGFINNGDTDKNQYGLTGLQWVPWCGFLEAAGVNLVEMNDEGVYRISYMNDLYKERTQNIVTLLSDLSAAEYTYLDFQTSAKPTVPFESNRALMTLTATIEIDDYLNYDVNFGVLPYPTYDTAQKEYRSLQWGGYLAIPNYLEKEQMVGETLELLAYYADDVKTAYYQKLLGKQIADNPDDRRMLDIIWDSVCTDFGQTFEEICGQPLYMLPFTTRAGQQSLAQFSDSRTKSGNTAIDKFFKRVGKQY